MIITILTRPLLKCCLDFYIWLDENSVLTQTKWSTGCVIAILLSCVAGLGMSFLSFLLRNMLSATSFAVVGNMCKVATIVVNTVIWDQHSDSTGIVALMMCLGSGAMYSQAPLRTSTYQEREMCPCLPRPLYRQMENTIKGVSGKILLSIPVGVLCITCGLALHKDRNEVKFLRRLFLVLSSPHDCCFIIARSRSSTRTHSPKSIHLR